MTTPIDPGQTAALRRIAKLIEGNGFRQDRCRRQALSSMEEYRELGDEREELLRLYKAAGGDPAVFELADDRTAVPA